MALTFKGVSIPGSNEDIQVPPFEVRTQEMEFFGLDGASEITGGYIPREIYCRHWFYNNYSTAAQLIAALATIHGLVGQNGTLVRSGNVSASYPNCTFKGFFPEPGTGIVPPSGFGWYAIGALRFRQLRS